MDAKTLEEILSFLSDDLGGDWLLTGGSLVRLVFDASRGTEDVDLVRIAHPELSDEAAKNRLFRWLIDRGLGPEWVNSAVEPFVREVEGWKRELVLVRTGTKGQIFRPNLTLFVYLKLRRGSEVDLADIRSATPNCPEGFDEKKFRAWAEPSLTRKFEAARAKLGL